MNIVDRVKTALEAHQDNQDLKLLVSGWQEARNRYAKDKSAANRKEWRAAEKDLCLVLDELPEPQDGGERRELPDPLQNLYQVWQYLRELGYSCSKAQPGRDVERKKLVALRAGGFSKASVRRYALTCKLKRLPGAEDAQEGAAPAPLDDIGAGAEKAQQQARLARLQADKIELALERERGNLVPAADLAITLASFAAVVEHELKSQMRGKSAKLLALVQGDAARKAAFVREMTDLVDAALRHAAEIEEYRVQFEGLGGAQQ